MKTEYLGLSAVGWHTMLDSWWNKVIGGFLIASVALGALYFLYGICLKVRRYWQRRNHQVAVSTAILRYITRLTSGIKPQSKQNSTSNELKSFGVFLGGFENPPTPAQESLLSQWDVVVLNPFERGVSDALSTNTRKSIETLGRVSLKTLAEPNTTANDDEIIRLLDAVVEVLARHFKNKDGIASPYTGVLLADFVDYFQPQVLNELAKYINDLGSSLWLELSPPDYLTESQCRETNMKHIGGIVYRNGTIRTEGDQCNFHQMNTMRTVQRTVAAQRVSHGPPVMMWETIDDGVEHQYAVIQRSFNWCRFNSARVWIGSAAALTDATAANALTVAKPPLGALMWLKNRDNMDAHNIWRANDKISQSASDYDSLYDSLNAFIPDLASKLRFTSDVIDNQITRQTNKPRPEVRYSDAFKESRSNPLSKSAKGDDFTGLGCFQLGTEVTSDIVSELLQGQRNLKELDLLQQVDLAELQEIHDQVSILLEPRAASAMSFRTSKAVTQLLRYLAVGKENQPPLLQVYVGLHSGFQNGSEVQCWGLYDIDVSYERFNLYLSRFAPNRASTVLHTYLSSQGCNRTECYMAEFLMAELNGKLSDAWLLPEQIVSDIEKLSPTELILLHQRVTVGPENDSFFLSRIRDCCENQLLDVPALTQLRALNSEAYLHGNISPKDLMESRLTWLRERGFSHADASVATQLFEDVDARLYEILMNGESDIYEQLGVVLRAMLKPGQIDAGADILAMAIFCAFRKLAIDEIYLEVLDRNPFPNHTADQAGCFAEQFAVGSRCDSFFDFTPRVLGRILATRYRAYYMKHQPPDRVDGYTELPTAYAAMKIDSDPEYGHEAVSAFYKVTFLGIFAVPALIDIMLLTTLGRGLYLTTFMSSTQKTMATTALMLALLMCGAVGGWINSGGCYYIYASAFPAMNMFVLTRFVAGVALVLIGGAIAFVVATVINGISDGLVFVFYFAILSTYLLLLSALSIYQVQGSSFQSGRTVIMACIPILFISPVLTTFVQHDVTVYVCVLSVFLCSLLFGARKVMSQWSNWYLRIPVVTDAEIIQWYAASRGISESGDGLKGLGATGEPRNDLHAAVVTECNRPFWKKSTSDPLIARLSVGYESTKFLMSWYCKHRRTQMPLAYSSTWNLTLKAGLENITNMQKGLKLHSAFLHWRHTGSDVWSGILYFVVALLDKWAALVSGGALVGLSAAGTAEYRLAVGFGLSYYLIGAVSLDTISQPLWTAANEKTFQPIKSLNSLRQVTINDSRSRRVLYWTNLVKFFFMHIWGIAITSALMWTFDSSRNAMIMYLAYLGAYTGLLWYQYNKIYCGTSGSQSLALAAILGFPAGVALHVCLPRYPYSGVMALAFGTWIAAIHSLCISGIGWPRLFQSESDEESTLQADEDSLKKSTSYSCSALEPYPILSQATLSKSFNSICSLPVDQRFALTPSQHPGARVLDHLVLQSRSKHSYLLEAAFPSSQDIIQRTIELWSNGKTVVEIVGASQFPSGEQQLRAIIQKRGQRVHVLVAVDRGQATDAWNMTIERNSRIIAEAVIQATCENHMGLSHDDSMLAGLLTSDSLGGDLISEGMKRQLQTSTAECTRVIDSSDKTTLRYNLLGVDCEREWDSLPITIRSFLLTRCSRKGRPLSDEEAAWIRSRMDANNAIEPEEFIARCDLGAEHAATVQAYAKQMGQYGSSFEDNSRSETPNPEHEDRVASSSRRSGAIKRFISRFRQISKASLKFLILSLVADPEYQRELDYMMKGQPGIVHWPITFFLNSIWSFCKFLQGLIIPLVLFHGREDVTTLQSNLKGMRTILKKNKVIIDSLKGPSTCFWTTQSDGSLRLSQYNGRHDAEPSTLKQLVAVNTYAGKFRLRQREEFKNEKLVNMFTYEYPQGGSSSKSKLPIQRQCVKGDFHGQIVQYDPLGYITTGSTFRDANPMQFTYWYRRNAKFEDELLRGEYVLPHITIRIMWSMPPRSHPERLDDWVPFTKVTEATFIQGSDVYHSSWAYEHKFHPEISTTLNGETVATPAMISEDWFHVLQKPTKCNFLSDNPLLAFSSVESNSLSRLLRLNIKRYPISTAHARTQLWQLWKGGRDLDAITARWIDESLVRSDSILKPYWRNRDMGLLHRSKTYLDAHADTIMARTDVDPEISAWLHIAFKIADYYSFGQGGDSTINTRTLQGQMQDSNNELHVLAMDTSTWPNEPGGVSACRRDMVNDLKTIKWSIVAETANDYGVPKFQIERNVKSLTVLPLWGLDFMTPTHGILRNMLDSEIVERAQDTSDSDIKNIFIPILTSLVQCARVLHPTRVHLEEATKALVDLNTFFEDSRHWNTVWNSDLVKAAWRELWLTEEQDDTLKVSQWWNYERPTLHQLDQALNMWHRYLFIFSIPVPEVIPDVFQASHHFTGATYGILCKVKRSCTLHVWDHCISFREFTTFMSSAVSFDMPFVNSSLMSLGHLSCVLLEHHADVVLPCAAYFNPAWEVELGTAEGAIQHRRTFARKIDPVVNGICNMDKFEPIKEIKTDKPTVVMLSHVQFVKDIKNAIMATDYIVNKWGFTDYRLHIYGDMERAAGHSTECQELIASKGLQDHAVLKGLGNASLVLQDAWAFLNSSISEGLPLAMGEAALTGVPVVCTDVGASFCVVTDDRTGKQFSEVVPPNDSESLARAQINILALLGQWAPHAEDSPGTTVPILSYPDPTPEEVRQISDRMYEKRDQRRKLGMMGRENVLNNFSSDRYLREHEQMLWIGKYRAPSYRARINRVYPSTPSSVWTSNEKATSQTELMSVVVRPPRLTPDNWSSAPSSRASSIRWFKE